MVKKVFTWGDFTWARHKLPLWINYKKKKKALGCQTPRSLNFVLDYHAKSAIIWTLLCKQQVCTGCLHFSFTKRLLNADMCQTLSWALQVHKPERHCLSPQSSWGEQLCVYYFNAAKVISESHRSSTEEVWYFAFIWGQEMGMVGEGILGRTYGSFQGTVFPKQIQTHGRMKQHLLFQPQTSYYFNPICKIV